MNMHPPPLGGVDMKGRFRGAAPTLCSENRCLGLRDLSAALTTAVNDKRIDSWSSSSALKGEAAAVEGSSLATDGCTCENT